MHAQKKKKTEETYWMHHVYIVVGDSPIMDLPKENINQELGW